MDNRWIEILVFVCMLTLFCIQSVALFHVMEQRDAAYELLINHNLNRR